MSTNEITPVRAKALIAALKRNPNLTDAADTCGVHPRTLLAAIKRGLMPNPDPQDRALARAARHSRAVLRADLFDVLKEAALGQKSFEEKGPNVQIAQWLIERMTDEGELTWQDALPGPQDAPQARTQLFKKPPPDLLADIHAAGMKLVPMSEDEKLLPAPVVDGELVEDPDE